MLRYVIQITPETLPLVTKLYGLTPDAVFMNMYFMIPAEAMEPVYCEVMTPTEFFTVFPEASRKQKIQIVR